MEYSFSSYPRAQGSHLAAGSLSGPDTGTLTIDLTDAPDGSTVLRAQEWWWHEPRPEQAVECTLNASGNLTCTEYPLIDAVEYVLLPMLAPRYFSGIPRYAYTVVFPANYYSSAWTVDLTARTSSGPVVAIDLEASSHFIKGPLQHAKLTAHVLYDRVRSLPDEIHADLTATAPDGGIDQSPSIDLKLTKDSSVNASGLTPAPGSSRDRPSMF